MKARELMIPIREYLRPDTTLREAAVILKTARRDEERVGVKGLPVLDSTGRMVGFLSMGDILKAVFPSYLSLMNLGEFTWNGMVEDLARKVGGKSVKEMMTTEVVSVDEDAPLMECIDHMLKHNVKRLPILGRGETVVGMLYERDIFLAVTRAMLSEEGGAA